jgi:ubiquinone/menaquinone biosynthesis C-methylase UbiE
VEKTHDDLCAKYGGFAYDRRQHPLVAAWWQLVRFGFRLLYNELAFTYDTVSTVVSLGQWRDWQRTALAYLAAPPGARVLELAHGTGNFEIDLRTAGYRTVALDLSRAMGQIARRKLVRWGLHPPLVRAVAQALPFPAASFPAVVSTFPTEFIVDPATLREVYRELAPGGRLVVVFSGMLTRQDATSEALEWAYRVTGQRGPWQAGMEERFHTVGFTVEVVAEELENSIVWLFVAHKREADAS